MGCAVESVIGHAKKAKTSVASKGSVQPILALESQLSILKIKELVGVNVDRMMKNMIPNLIDKAAIDICEGEMRYAPSMKDKGASVVVHADIGSYTGSYPGEKKVRGVSSVRAEARSIPFEDGFFDFTVANIAAAGLGDAFKIVKEIGRMMALGGNAVIIDFHPFGRFAKKGKDRLRSFESVVRGVEDYYKICQGAGFHINYIKEAFFDETVRSLFESPEEKAAYRSLKETPFLILLAVSKKGIAKAER